MKIKSGLSFLFALLLTMQCIVGGNSIDLFNDYVYAAEVENWIKPVALVDGCETRYGSHLFDGDENTIWQHFEEERHWIVLDMGQSVEINQIRQWHRQRFDTEYAIEEIYVSDDLNDFGESVGSFRRINNEEPGWKEVELSSKTGRYVKLVMEHCRTPYIREIEFSIVRWVKPVAVVDGCETRYGSHLFDGDENTIWQHFEEERHWIVLDMGQSVEINQIRQWHRQRFDTEYAIEEIYVSDDLDDFGESVGSFRRINNEEPGWKDAELSSKTGRYVKFVTELCRSPYLRDVEFSVVGGVWDIEGTETIIDETADGNTPTSETGNTQEEVSSGEETGTNTEAATGDIEIVSASLSIEDIEAAITLVRNQGGGSVVLPAGEIDHEGARLRLTAGIEVIGQGVDNTKIMNANFYMDTRSGTHFDALTRLSGMYLGGSSTIEFREVEKFRIDHIHLVKDGRNGITFMDVTNGVIDNSYFDTTNYGIMITTSGTLADDWNTDTLAVLEETTAGDTIFVEDCEFINYHHALVGHNNGRYVARYNIFHGGNRGNQPGHPIDAHGDYYAGDMGTRLIEVYNNVISGSTNTLTQSWKAIAVRGGSAVIFNNTYQDWRNGVVITLDSHNDEHDTPANRQTWPQDIWIWDNSYEMNVFEDNDWDTYVFRTNNMNDHGLLDSFVEIVEGEDFFLRAPSMEEDGFEYIPYIYPHPFRDDGSK